jgi:hypothetical protein
VAKTNNFIELNGKRYDALTGAFLGTGRQAAVTARPASTPKATAARGTVMDGVVPMAVQAAPQHQPASARIATPKPTIKHHVKPLTPHQPEHAKTLRRDVVKQPVIKPQKPLKAHMPTDVVKHKPGVLTVTPKLSSDVVDPARATRALDVSRSPHVERFRKQPQPRYTGHAAATPAQPVRRPIESIRPARTSTGIAPRAAHHTHSANAEDDVFEQAIAYAKSHEQAAPKESGRQKVKRASRRHKRFVGILASVLMVVALGGFIFWQNRADVELQLAAARSGVPASMPAYKPSGFAVKGLTYSPGTVTIGFGNGNKSFNVTQKSSNWDSETLLQNYVATSGQPYDAYQAAGRTVYVYGNGNATWVNGGIWYQINDSGNLSKDQIINLATSM